MLKFFQKRPITKITPDSVKQKANKTTITETHQWGNHQEHEVFVMCNFY